MTQLGMIVHDLVASQMRQFFLSGDYTKSGFTPSADYADELLLTVAVAGMRQFPCKVDSAVKKSKHLARAVRILMETLHSEDTTWYEPDDLVEMVIKDDKHGEKFALDAFPHFHYDNKTGVFVWKSDCPMEMA